MVKMKITVIGAGNLGTILATKFSKDHEVRLYEKCDDEILSVYENDYTIYFQDEDRYYTHHISLITNNLKDAVCDADYIFITYPAFLLASFEKELGPLLVKGQHLVFIPGCGGGEFVFHKYIEKGITITGLQRVHSVARILEKGKLTKEAGVKKELFVASIPQEFNHIAVKDIQNLYGIPTTALPNYLNVTLINSNPLLHTSRLYSLFKEYPIKDRYENVPLFYEEWDLDSATILSEMDQELSNLFIEFSKYNLPVNMIKPIMEYYDSSTPLQMMNKLRSIESFKGLISPVIKNSDGTYSPDLSSRYFTADFPYGLDIILDICKMMNVKCKKMEEVSSWYHKISNTKKTYSLKDFDINDKETLIKLYR